MSPENYREDFKELKKELRDNTKLTQEGFRTMNSRMKKVELAEAERRGREKATTSNYSGDWKKAFFQLLGVLTLAASIGLAVAKGVF